MAARIADISEVVLALGLSASITDEERAICNEALKRSEAFVRRYLHYDPVQASRTEFYPQGDFSNYGGGGVWDTDGTNAFFKEVDKMSAEELQLTHIPIRSITSLSIDYDGRSGTKSGAFATLETEGVSFWPNYDMLDSSGNKVCRDGILRSHGLWPAIPGSVKIVYVAGYTDAELHGEDEVIDASPILEAVVDEAIRRVKKIYSRQKTSGSSFESGLKTKEKLGNYSYETDSRTSQILVGGETDLLPETQMKLDAFVHYGLFAV